MRTISNILSSFSVSQLSCICFLPSRKLSNSCCAAQIHSTTTCQLRQDYELVRNTGSYGVEICVCYMLYAIWICTQCLQNIIAELWRPAPADRCSDVDSLQSSRLACIFFELLLNQPHAHRLRVTSNTPTAQHDAMILENLARTFPATSPQFFTFIGERCRWHP